VDADGAVDELNENNNVALAADPADVIDPTLDDFVDLVGAFRTVTLPSTSIPGDRGRVSLTVTNEGNVRARGRITVDIYASVDEVLSPDTDRLMVSVDDWRVNLRPYASRSLTRRVTIPSDLLPETYHWIAHIDRENAIAESNENNNRQALHSEVTEVVWKFGSFKDRRNVKLILNDENGTPVRFSLSGKGVGSVVGFAQRPAFGEVVLVDTDHRSSAVIRPLGRGATTSVGDLTVRGSLKSFNAKSTDLRGNILVEGTLGTLHLHDVGDGNTITIGPPNRLRDTVTMRFNDVAEATVESQTRIQRIVANTWVDVEGNDEIHAPRIDAIAITSGTLGATVRSDGAIGSISVRDGDLSGNVTADAIRSISVHRGSLTGDILALNTTGEADVLNEARMTWRVLRDVYVKGGNITGAITVANGGSVRTIIAKSYRGVGGAIGDGDADTITIDGMARTILAIGSPTARGGNIATDITVDRAGRIESKYGDLSGHLTVLNAAGRGRNALGVVDVFGGDFTRGLTVGNDGSVGTISIRAHRYDGRGNIEAPIVVDGDLNTLQADHIAADVTVAGRARTVRTYGDEIAEDAATPAATVTTGGRSEVHGLNGVIVIDDEGGEVDVV